MINPYEYRKKAQLAIRGVDYNVQPLVSNNQNTVQEQSGEEQSWFVRGLSTLGNVVKNVVQGCVKSLEGIVDAGAMLVGLFGADVDSFVNYDFTADVFGTDEEGEGLLSWSWGRALSNASYLDDDNFVNQVANGVGGMLPTIALAALSGGSSLAGTAAAKALSIGSKVAFVAGAAGNASEEAFKQGASYGQALGYGALSGAIEAGTEYIGGRVMGETTDLSKTLLGKLALKTGTDKAISTGIGKAAYTFVSEGMEEVLSDLLNPVAKRITGVDKDATVDWGQLPKTFLVGGATASVLNGIQNGASALKNSERGGKHYVRVAEQMQTIENTIGAQATLQSKQGITQEQYDAIGTRANERTLRSLENMSSEFKKMTSEERANALKTIAENSPTIASVFDENGDIKTSIKESIQESITNRVVGNSSADLVLRGEEIQTTIDEVNKENGYSLEIDNDALTEVERGNYAKEIKAIQNIGNISNSNLSLVLVKNNDNVNSFIEKRGNIIYATRETLSNGTWANKLAHEITHFAEDSKEFKRFVDYVLEDQKAVQDAINDIIKAGYKLSENDLTRTISKLASDKKLTKKENLAYSELIAHISEKLFTDEKSINRLARSDKGLFNKIKNRISDMIDALKDTNAKETVQKLRKAEKLFNNALQSIAKEKEEFARKLRKTTNEYKRDKKIYNMLEEDEKASWLEEHGYVAEDFNDDVLDNGEQQEQVDFSPEMAYSKKGYEARNPSSITEKDFNHHYWAIANEIISKEEIGVLNSSIGKLNNGEFFNQNADGFYMIPVGKNGVLNKIVLTDGKNNRYSIDTVIEINLDNETSLSIERGIIYASERKGIHAETNDLLKIYYAKDFKYSEFRRNSAENLSNSDGKQDGRRSNREVKFDLKIGDENITVKGEETKNLVALHNLSEEKLMKVLNLGGFPMPSIAITKADLPHEHYGNITVVFGKETIDPEGDYRNRVYDRDAWTPTTPTVDIKLNTDKVDNLIESLQLKVKNYSGYSHEIDRFFDGKYKNNSGEYVLPEYDYSKESITKRAFSNTGIVAAYLQEKGKDIAPVYSERGFTMGWSSFTREEAKNLLDYLGVSKNITRENITAEQRKNILDKFIEYKAKEKYRFLRKRKPDISFDAILETVKNELDDGHVSQIMFMAEDFYNENRPKDVYNDSLTAEKLEQQVADKEDFNNWFWSKFEETFDKKGIDNDSDVFDRYGNRKSFEQRHYAYTLNNIVKMMSKGEQEGKATWGISAGSLAAKLSTQFETIQDIKDAEDYLALVSEEEIKAFNDKTYELYDEIVSSIVGDSGDFMSNQSRRDDAGDILARCASKKLLSVEEIKREFNYDIKKYNLTYKINNEIANKAITLFELLSHVPTTYFEAKPRRAVGLDEIKMVLLPESSSQDFVSKLEEKDIPYQKYNGQQGERTKIIQELGGIRFSLKQDSNGRALTEEQEKYFRDSKIRDDKGNLLVVYHGSPKAGFTVFNTSLEGSYFTANKDYAADYARFNKDNVYAVYLNIKKPFDTRDPKAKKIFEEEFFGKWGNGAPLTERGMLDWTDGADMFDFIQEKGLDYDGLIIDEGGVPTFDDSIYDRGISFVAFYPNQIKNIDNLNPTEDEDIRFSLKQDSEGKELSEGQKRFFKDSKVVDQNGNLLVLYHGTNSENFYVFDKHKIGSASGDRGFFGEGFYFVINKGEAKYYGDRIVESYVNIKNPYYFSEELFEYKNQKAQYDKNSDLIFITNFVDKFSDILPQGLSAYSFANHKDFSLKEIAKIYKQAFSSKKFNIIRTEEGDYGKEYIYATDKKIVKFTDKDGEEHSFEEYGFTINSLDKKLSQAELASMYVIKQYDLTNIPNFKQIILETDFSEKLKSLGYDGTMQSKEGDEIVAFYSNQIKRTDNLNPTENEDIRFSRKPANDIKAKANLVYDSIYTKKETRQIIEDILSQAEGQIDEMTEGDYTASIKGKTSIIETLFEKLNSAESQSKTKIAREMADHIVNAISVEEVAKTETAEESFRELKAFRPYLHSIDTSAYSKEIRTVKGNNALILQWGKKGGMEIYDVVRNLQEEGFLPQINLQDAFNDFDLFEQFTDYYKSLLDDVNNASKTALSLVLSENKLNALKESIAKDLLEMVKEGGELSTLGKLKETFTTSIKELKQQFAKNANYWKAKATYQGDIWRTVADLRGYTEKGKIEKLGSATVLKDPYFKKMLEDMGKITWGGKIDPVKARACMQGLKQFFNKDNKLLQDYFEATYGETLSIGDISQATTEIEGTSNSMFNHLLDQFAELELAKREDGTYKTTYLTTEELKATATILKMCKHFLLHYDAIYEDGKRIEQKQAATKYYELAEKSYDTHTVHKTQFMGWLSSKVFDYNAMIMSPKFVCEMLDGYYKDGFNTHYQQRFWRDSLQMEYDRMTLLENSDKFFKENKDYKKRLFDKEIQVKIGNYSLTIAEAVDLYLMSTQDNGLLTLTEGAGFVFDNERGGVTQCGTVSKEQIDAMYEQFTEKDKEYIKILKDIYKKGGIEYKKPTDIARMGFSNIIDGEYYTLTRWKEAIARSTSDIRSAIKDIQIANNLSINKARRTRAKNIPLMVGNSYQKMIRYVNQITLYKNFSEDLANFDKLFTKNISDTTSPKTIKMIMDGKVWDKTSKYWGDLLADVQGVGMAQDNVSSSITKVLEALRTNYAKAQLGFNLKVCLSQFASYPTAFIKLDAGVLMRALGHKVNYEDMDKYSQSALTRHYNKAIVKAEGVLDKVSSLSDALTKGIQWSDRKTIGRLWVASQLQIEKTEGLKFGSPENMKKAGLLLDEVITETQPTYMAIDRSALQRSKNTLAKTISMFTSVPMKQVSNLIGSIAKLRAYKTRIRLGEHISDRELNQAKKGVARAVGANVAANLMYAMVCQLVKHLYNKDDEDENDGKSIPEQILSQFMDTSISMFPIISDIYEGIAKGYEIDIYETSAINDLIASTKSIVDLAGKVISGDADTQDLMNSLKKSLFASGLIVGIPIRNMYNTVYGFTKRISPSTAYKINSLFTDPKPKDLKAALKKNDTELASTIVSSLMGKKGFSISKEQARTLAELYGEGYSLPSSIPDKITINGEEVALTTKQQGEFGAIYSKASSVADRVLSDGSLNGKTSEVQARTISYIYKYYYYEAQAKTLNMDVDSKLYMFGQLIDIQKLASIIAEVPLLSEGAKNKKAYIQKYLQKQKLSAAQKYILMGYFGYKNKNGKGLVKALINKTNLSKAQKEELLEKCGY